MRRTVAAFLVVSAATLAFQANAQLQALETEDLRLIYYDPVQTYLTPHVARSFESAFGFYREFYGYEPSEQVTVKLWDTSDVGGGSAGALPTNNLTVGIAPLTFSFETMPPSERMITIMNHELLHLVSMDQATGSDLRARRFFRGKVLPTPDHPETLAYMYMTTPRVAVPAWFQEGGAVFMETWMAGGLGRAQGAYDEMVFRAMVRDGAHFYDPLGLVSEGIKSDFQVGMNSYLYGARFMSYLAYHHSPEKVVSWLTRTEGTEKYYAKDFERAFGMPIREAWRDWIDWEHEFQEKNLAAIRQYPTTPYRDLSDRALGSISSAFHDPATGEIFAGFAYPGAVSQIGSISTADGTLRNLVEIKAPVIYAVTSLAYDPEARKVFFTSDNQAYRDLRVVDVDSGKSEVLLKDQRIGDLAFNAADRSIWGIRHLNGIATLVRVPYPYEEWFQVHSWPYGEVIYDLDVSPDGTSAAVSLARINGKHSVQVLDLQALIDAPDAQGPVTAVNEFNLGGTIVNDFVFSPDGRYLYGSSYYTGVSNIFRFDLADGGWQCVSNAETGFFRPIPLGDDELIVFRFTGEGLVPARIRAEPLEDVSPVTFLGQQVAEKHPVVREWVPDSPASIPLDDRIESDEEYRGIREVELESIYPIIEGYKESEAVGFAANFSDPMFFNRFSLTASYSPDDELLPEERGHLHFKYYRPHWEFDLKWNDADFYDLFGPTKASRKGYSAGVHYTKSLIYDLPRQLDLNVDAAYYADMDTLPRYQNVPAEIDSLTEGMLSLSYSNQRASLGAVDYEKGLTAAVFVGATYVDGDLIPGFVGTIDYGIPLPAPHTSIWLRSAVGANVGDLYDPFANFYFGGFGNNWVDHGDAKRYRSFFSFPGVELNEIPGRSFAKSMLEWNLPPVRFRRAGSPGFFLTWMRGSLFAGAIRTNVDDDNVARDHGTMGAQLDFRFEVLSKFKMTLSLGYAAAFESGMDTTDEFMFSLNVLN
jgi:hypothetical protein